MHKETVKYIDYNGVERTEDVYFNLSKAELMEMQLSTAGGFDAMINKLIKAQDQPTLVKIFKDIILRSYGVPSPDGRRFVKTKELTEEFTQTEAYSDLYMKFITDSEAAAKFINGIMPKSLIEQMSKQANSTMMVPAI